MKMFEMFRFPGLTRAVALTVISGLLWVGTVRADGAAARAVVEKTGADVIAILQDKSLDKEAKRKKIEAVVSEHFDFETLSRLVLARHWKKLTPDQQHKFVDEFRTHLSITYGNNIETYNDEKLVITGDREEKRGDWTVKSIIDRTTAEDVKVDYRLRHSDAGWRMIDVIVEGVSLVSNFRAQFQDIVSKQGADKLIAMLHEKTAKGESFKGSQRKTAP